MLRRLSVVVLVGLAALAGAASAQTNVRAFYAKGQTFVVWEETSPAPVTYEIYRSSVSFTDVSQATLAGRLFRDEWKGERLDYISDVLRAQGATWLIPTDNQGSTYSLAGNEGLFVFTPRSAISEYFAVVKTGDTLVGASNLTVTAVVQDYDPVNDPIQCHVEFSGVSPQGYPYRVHAMWSDGNDDIDNARPDVPVTANAAKNGAPHVFVVYEPPGGAGPGPYPAVMALHGNGGRFDNFRPGFFDNIGLDISEGLFIAPSDHLLFQTENTVTGQMTRWIGYVSSFDPFTTAPRVDPPPGSVVMNYTSRRIFWILDWLQGPTGGYGIDADRVSLIGHSAGGWGASALSRMEPERFASVVLLTPGLRPNVGANPTQGCVNLNLPTNVEHPPGVPVGLTDLLRWSVRLSNTSRDFALTRVFSGLRDPKTVWDSTRVEEYEACNEGGLGFQLYWDERDHGVGTWDDEDPMIPGMDIGQWIVPERTEVASATYQHRYRASESYPAFFDEDQDLSLPGRQPDIGLGDPNEPPPYGTWCGYFDWDPSTLVDDLSTWACTLFLRGLSPVQVDNAPYSTSMASVTLRRTQSFQPEPGLTASWQLTDLAGAVLQSGTTVVDPDGVVVIPDLLIPRDPDRVRLVVTSRSCAVLAGNVDTGPGGQGPADVLLINGTSGEDCRRVIVDANEPLTVEIMEPPSRIGQGAHYWLGVWVGRSRPDTVRALPANLGPIGMPLLIVGGTPQPRLIANNIPGSSSQLGVEDWPGPVTQPAPYVLLNFPLGARRPGAVAFFQGLVRDEDAPGNFPYAVTNGIQLEISP